MEGQYHTTEPRLWGGSYQVMPRHRREMTGPTYHARDTRRAVDTEARVPAPRKLRKYRRRAEMEARFLHDLYDDPPLERMASLLD